VARLALAYLFRRPVQILAVLGVAIGLLALLVVLAVMNGLIQQDRDSVRGPLSDLLLIPAVTTEVPLYAEYRDALEKVPEVAAVAPHLVVYALLGSTGGDWRLQSTRNSDSNAVQLVGIDFAAEMDVTHHPGGFLDSLKNARHLPTENLDQPFHYPGENRRSRGGVLVSDRLRADFEVGDRLEVISLPYKLPPPDQPLVPANGSFVIAGTYSGSDYEMSLDRIYVPRNGTFKGLHNTLVGRASPDFTEILIRLHDGVDYAAGKLAVQNGLREAGLPTPSDEQGGAIQSWEDRRALFLGAIENERRVTTLVMFFIVVISAFGIFATLSALVREKVRDLGVLAALGFSPIRRGNLLLVVGATGSAAGAILGHFGAWWIVKNHLMLETILRERFGVEVFRSDLYVIEGIPVQWNVSVAVLLTISAFLVGVLFTLGPAWRAARLSPVAALRYE
jgi:lipoprotein-releasing system permease protein